MYERVEISSESKIMEVQNQPYLTYLIVISFPIKVFIKFFNSFDQLVLENLIVS